MSSDHGWSKEQIIAMLDENSFSYQNVPLPHGLETGGHDRSDTARAIFGEDVAGKSVFDLGCKYGYFCFAAEESGAVKIRGVDIEPENIRKSRLLAQSLGSIAQFERLDIEKQEIQDRYDYVLCLNVLHHLRNPLAVLEKLIVATRQKLVLEVAGFALRDRRQNGVSLLLAALLSRVPVFYLATNSSQTFFITIAAIRVLLLEKRADFARVEVIRSGPKGRPIIVAHRRSIDRLIIVAGMPAGGKTTLIKYLLSTEGSKLARELGIDSPADWQVLQFGKLGENQARELGNVIVHYNICQYLIKGDVYQHSNALSDLISIAGQVRIVTLACPRQRLLDQFFQYRVNKTSWRIFSRSRRSRKNKKLIDLYKDRHSMNEMYADWFRFLDEAGHKSLVVSHDGGRYSVTTDTNLRDF